MKTAQNYHFKERQKSIFKLAWEMAIIFFYFGLVLAAYLYLSETGHSPESSLSKSPASEWHTDF
jgi:hypothetical protein